MVRRFQIFAFLSVIVFSVSGVVRVEGRKIETKANDFLIKKWTTEDGLPQNTVTSIVQTDDGYIWLGTFGGLARFDGIKFTVFDSTNAPGLASNRILSLYEDRWKRLWIGTETGEVYTLESGKFTEFKSDPEFKRRTVWEFIEDDEGRFYIASDSGLERVEFREDGSAIPDSIKIISRNRAYKLAKGPGNTIWTSFGAAFVVQGDQLVRAESVDRSEPSNILNFSVSGNGRVVIQTISSFGYFENGKFSDITPQKDGVSLGGCTPAFRFNDLWCQQGGFLNEFKDGDVVTHDIRDFVTAGSRAILFDKEDNIWLATESDGLVRLTRRKIALVGDMTDLNVWGRYALAQDAEGVVWIAGHDLLKIQNGNVKSIPIPDNVAGSQLIKALAVDRNNLLWAGGVKNLYVVRNDILEPVPQFGAGPINSLFFDRQNTLWIGSDNGLWKYVNGQFAHFTTSDGLVADNIRFITQTQDDTIWIGTIGGVSKIKDGKFENITPENGLSGNYVREILEDDDGTLWIGTYGGGINRLRDGKIQAITATQGLKDNFVSRILIDNDGKFWVLGNLGIFAVSRDELNAVADQKKQFLVGAVYGMLDGMKSSEASGGHQYAGIKTRDGRLWFPMIKDVVIIDPQKVDLTPPKVVIERASTRLDDIGSRTVEVVISETNSIFIPTGQRDLEIQFTALSFTKPEMVRFYYKLDGLDDDWTDAGGRRTAAYPYLSRLAPGKYTFHVRAVSASGVWSENTAVLTIDVAKYFWQTWWFILAVVMGAIFVSALLYWFKLEQIRGQRRKEIDFSRQLLRAQEVERGRIATELHDGLGQNLLILKNWAQLGLDASEDPAEVREHLLQISESAAQSIDETRSIVRNLSPRNLKRFGLTEAIRNMTEQIESATGVTFERKLENIDGFFPDEAELSIYRIVQECLNNIIKHSESPRGRVSITRIDDTVSIVIADYGKGFATKQYFEADGQARGFGIRSVMQRVRLLGGEIGIESRDSEGTQIRIRLRK